MHTPGLEIRLGFSTQRALLTVGLIGSLTVVLCNTILYAHGDLVDWPSWALNLAYWGGSIALAFAGVGFVPTYTALRPAGPVWAAPPAALLAFFLALGSAGHGAFFPHYRVLRAVRGAHDSETIAALESVRVEVAMDNLVMLCVPVFVLLVGSVWYSLTVWLRPTLYPRWMAAWNPFALSCVVMMVAMWSPDGSAVHILAKGLGFHLALSGYFLLSLYFLTRAWGELRHDEVLRSA